MTTFDVFIKLNFQRLKCIGKLSLCNYIRALRGCSFHATIFYWSFLSYSRLIPRSHLRTDASDRGGCSIRRDPQHPCVGVKGV